MSSLDFLAVPRHHNGVAREAESMFLNMTFTAQHGSSMAQKDWAAYQNLLQLVGMLKTANLTIAASVCSGCPGFRVYFEPFSGTRNGALFLPLPVVTPPRA